MLTITVLVALLALPYPLGGPPWEKPPEKWSITDVYHILQDSPWSPSDVKIEAKGAPRQGDARTGMPAPSPIDSPETNTVPGGQLGFSKPQAPIPVIWWSSKTIRLAGLRLRQLRDSAQSKDPLKVEDLPDFVLVIEGSEQLRILRDAKEDLHDTSYLEIPNQGTIDLATVEFVEGVGDQEPRVEFHFPRQMDGQPTLDPDLDRVIFHVKATAKTPRPFQDNTVALRAEFRPKNMRVRGVPDL